MPAPMPTLLKWLAGERGQGLSEYALIIAFVIIVCIAAVTALGVAILGPLNDIAAGF